MMHNRVVWALLPIRPSFTFVVGYLCLLSVAIVDHRHRPPCHLHRLPYHPCFIVRHPLRTPRRPLHIDLHHSYLLPAPHSQSIIYCYSVHWPSPCIAAEASSPIQAPFRRASQEFLAYFGRASSYLGSNYSFTSCFLKLCALDPESADLDAWVHWTVWSFSLLRVWEGLFDHSDLLQSCCLKPCSSTFSCYVFFVQNHWLSSCHPHCSMLRMPSSLKLDRQGVEESGPCSFRHPIVPRYLCKCY